MRVFAHPEYRNHEQVLFCREAASDLSAVIAIHSSALGPAGGACRMLPYDSLDAAVTDVLRLSYAMTIKNALAGLPLGVANAFKRGAAEENQVCRKTF